MELIFWGLLFVLLYTYLGYPLLLVGLGKVWGRPVKRGEIWPRVSLVVSVYNGEQIIRRKLENCLMLDYPKERLEMIVASDCSSDKTHEIVQQFACQDIRLVASPKRFGKEAAQKLATEKATGEIVVFTDAGILLEPDTLKTLVSNFADPRIGCVSGEDRALNAEGDVVGEGAYVRYETLMRRLESRINSVAGMSGWLFAVRKSLCSRWPERLASDFYMLLMTIKSGYRGICDPQVIGYSWVGKSDQREFQRKVRTIVRGIAVLMDQRDILNPFRFGIFSFQLFSHKVLRWLVPFFLIGLFMSNLLLLFEEAIYLVFLLSQALFYGLAVAGYLWVECRQLQIFRIPYFFTMSNLAILVAWWRYLRGERFVVWEPTPREREATR